MSELIDYAMPMMRIEIILKKMHNALLEDRLAVAQMLSVDLTTETRVLRNTLILMKDKQDALRQQTKTVQEGIPATVGPGGTREPNGSPAGAAGDGRQGR
jgi:hypothetical protein